MAEDELRQKYELKKDGRDWTLKTARQDIVDNSPSIVPFYYRALDFRFVIWTGKTKGILSFPRNNVMHNLLEDNVSLLLCRQQSTFDFQHAMVTKFISDRNAVSMQTRESSTVFPLYLYPESNNQQTLGTAQERTPNLNMKIVGDIAKKIGLTFTPEKEEREGTFAPIDILDYIYAVLHSPAYREKYKEFLKIDFPRVPYPDNAETFRRLVKRGGELRQIHLLESPVVEKFITTYPIGGDNTVTRSIGKKDFDITDNAEGFGRVWINDTQYFDKVPTTTWEFYIGGYQSAQKWLKDRKGRVLSYEDIIHYQKIVVALSETDRLMKEIDEILKVTDLLS